jgi:hypothetical protein
MTTSKEFKLDLSYGMFPSETDQYGIVFDVNSHGFRTSEFNTVDHTHKKFIVFGDSHTWGEGNRQCDIWPELLKEKINISQMFNLGQRGCSSDYMVRIMPACLEYFKPDYVFVLWADSSRFENEKDGVFTQTLVSNPNKEWRRIIKIKGIDWPEENYKAKTAIARNLCNSLSIPLIELTLQDLIPVMDHADCWPKAVNGTHYNKSWHNTVADIFADKFKNL